MLLGDRLSNVITAARNLPNAIAIIDIHKPALYIHVKDASKNSITREKQNDLQNINVQALLRDIHVRNVVEHSFI